MRKVMLRGIAANKGRLVLSLLSILLGVSCVAGSFILADSLRSVFDQISEDIFAGTDAQVRAVEPEFSTGFDVPRFDESVLTAVAELPGIEEVGGSVGAVELIYSVDPVDGGPVRPQGPPVFTNAWDGPSPLSPFTLVEGEAPAGQQVALDIDQVEQGNFSIGDTIGITGGQADGIEEFELSGIVQFGTTDSVGGAYFLLFDLPTEQRLIGADGQLDSIFISADPGVDTATLVADIATVLPEGVEVVPSEVVVSEQQADFGSFIDIFGNILLGFALVILFVSIFIIYNTFAILVGQRTKQIGLLRAIGASGPQVRWMVLIESLLIGLVASIVGILGGVGIARLLKWVFSLGGASFPDGPLEILPRTIVWSLVVGVVVTVLSALAPAFRASRVSPLEALRDGAQSKRSSRFRVIAGLLVLAPGVILLGLGLFGGVSGTSAILSSLGFGSVLTFIGVSMLSALFAGQVSSIIGAPIEKLTGTTGKIGRDNASRNPQRTAATATALMIGLALITGVSVLAQSIRVSLKGILEEAVTAELFIFETAQGLPFSSTLVTELDALDEVGQVVGVKNAEIKIEGDVQTVSALDNPASQRLINVGVESASADLAPEEVLVYTGVIEDGGPPVGTTLQAEFEDGETTTLTVAGTFDDNTILATDWIVSRNLVVPHLTTDAVDFVAVSYADGVDSAVGRVAVDATAANYPQVEVQNNDEFIQGQEDQINQLLFLVWGLLGLSLVIAFFGIVNTMALSVLERTREIGLLRAVGMTRAQLKRAIRYESAIVAVFGSLLGVVMGVILAWAGVTAVPDEFISDVAIPWVLLIVFLVIGAIFGVLAAIFPARRASKLNVLDAIATT